MGSRLAGSSQPLPHFEPPSLWGRALQPGEPGQSGVSTYEQAWASPCSELGSSPVPLRIGRAPQRLTVKAVGESTPCGHADPLLQYGQLWLLGEQQLLFEVKDPQAPSRPHLLVFPWVSWLLAALFPLSGHCLRRQCSSLQAWSPPSAPPDMWWQVSPAFPFSAFSPR